MITKKQVLENLDQIKKYLTEIDTVEWIEINNENCPTLEKYGVKPFKIMKNLVQKDGEPWVYINFFDAKKEAENMGYRLPDVREILALLDHYTASGQPKDFLGIEDLEDWYEWIDGPSNENFGWWRYDGPYAGLFTLNLAYGPGYSGNGDIGFRCVVVS